MKVDPGHVAMFEPTVSYEIEMVKGITNMFLGGEGLFLATLNGPGRVWLQTMPLQNMARAISRFIRQQAGDQRVGLYGRAYDVFTPFYESHIRYTAIDADQIDTPPAGKIVGMPVEAGDAQELEVAVRSADILGRTAPCALDAGCSLGSWLQGSLGLQRRFLLCGGSRLSLLR